MTEQSAEKDAPLIVVLESLRDRAAGERASAHANGEPLTDYGAGVIDGIDRALLAARSAERLAAQGERIASAANYPGAVTELLGYLGEAIDDGRQLDAREMHEYVRDLKRRYVTDPVRAAIAAESRVNPPESTDDDR